MFVCQNGICVSVWKRLQMFFLPMWCCQECICHVSVGDILWQFWMHICKCFGPLAMPSSSSSLLLSLSSSFWSDVDGDMIWVERGWWFHSFSTMGHVTASVLTKESMWISMKKQMMDWFAIAMCWCVYVHNNSCPLVMKTLEESLHECIEFFFLSSNGKWRMWTALSWHFNIVQNNVCLFGCIVIVTGTKFHDMEGRMQGSRGTGSQLADWPLPNKCQTKHTRTTVVAALLKRDSHLMWRVVSYILLFHLIACFPSTGKLTWIITIYFDPSGDSTGRVSIGFCWFLMESVSLRLWLVFSRSISFLFPLIPVLSVRFFSHLSFLNRMNR